MRHRIVRISHAAGLIEWCDVWIRARADRFMVGATTGRRSRDWQPEIAIIITESVERVCARGRIRNKSPPGFLIGPEYRIEASDRIDVGHIFPQSFATLRLRRRPIFRRSNAPDRPDVHRHDVMCGWIKPDIKFTAAGFSRRARRRVEILIARNTGDCWVRSAKTATAATAARKQFNCYVYGFA